MTARPLISVITPYLDVAPYLAEAIESVLAQSVSDWELILVDDGSRDGSSAIAHAYAARHPDRIVCIEHAGRANLGISASRNAGRRAARGDWIAYLDADDVWYPDKLAVQLAIAEAHPEVGLIMGASLYWHGWTGRAEDAARDEVILVGAPPDTVYEPPHLMALLYPLGTGAAPSMNGVLVRTELLDAVGGWEDSFRSGFDDQALLTKLYLSTKAYVSSRVFDRYRQRPGSICASELRGGGYAEARLRFLDWLEAHLAAHGVPNARIAALLREALRPYRHPLSDRAIRFGRRVTRGLRDRLVRAMGAP